MKSSSTKNSKIYKRADMNFKAFNPGKKSKRETAKIKHDCTKRKY